MGRQQLARARGPLCGPQAEEGGEPRRLQLLCSPGERVHRPGLLGVWKVCGIHQVPNIQRPQFTNVWESQEQFYKQNARSTSWDAFDVLSRKILIIGHLQSG